jgi:tRNA G18 (ribose-2'-O)-methylase SpoU
MSDTQANIRHMRDAALTLASSSYNVHDHLKQLTVPELQAKSLEDRLPWHTLCLNVTGDLNVGTIIRTSHCLGASSVTIFGRQRIDNRSLVGSANYIKIEKIPGIDQNFNLNPEVLLHFLNSKNLIPIFVECGGQPINQVNWPLRLSEMQRRDTQPCLIMGNETGGIPQNILDLQSLLPNSFVVSIPQRGVIRSFNVATAHAMIAFNLCEEMKWL